MKNFALVTFLAVAGSSLSATEGQALLKAPVAARSAALGGAFSMIGSSAEAMGYNPAGVAGLNGGELGFSHAAWMGGSSSEYLFGAYGQPNWSLGAFGRYAAVDDVARDSFGRSGSTFTNSEQFIGMALALKLDRLRFGIGGKVLEQSVGGRTDHGYVGDLGGIATFMDGHLALSLAALNIGTAPNIGTGNSVVKPPLNFRAGLGLLRLAGLKVVGEYRRWDESAQDSLAAGAEFIIGYRAAQLAWRCGYESGLAVGGASGANLGFGIGYDRLRLDYSIQILGDLGNSQRLSLDWRFKPIQAEATDLGTKLERMRRAKEAYLAGHYGSAAEIYGRLADEYPESYGIQSSAGMSELKRGDREAALRHFRIAVSLRPGNKALEDWIREAERH